MKILLFTLEYPPFKGGVANTYENIVRHWSVPENVFVLNNNKNELIKRGLPFLAWLPCLWRLWSSVKKNKINHVLVGHVLPLGTATLLLARMLKIKYSVFLHGMDFSFACRSRRKKFLMKKILEKSDNIICGNTYLESEVKKFLPEQKNKIFVVNPGVNPEIVIDQALLQEIKEEYDLKNKIVLLQVGRLVKRKGQDKVIKAMPAILTRVPNLVYFIAGAGADETYLKKKVAELPASAQNRIVFLGRVSDEKKWAWLQTCDIFIMPSRNIDGDFEGFGIVYLEANLLEKPTIAGRSGGVEDAVKHGVNGLLVDSEKSNQIAQAVIALAQDRELQNKLGQQGRERALKDFAWKKQIEKIYKIINQL